MDAVGLSNLIKDFTTKLATVAEEFGERANGLAGAIAPDSDEAAPQSPSHLSLAKQLIEQRQLRQKFLPDELFHEPAWDMLLALYVFWQENRTTNVKYLVACTPAPVTTAHRWIDHIAKLGLVTRNMDMADKRRIEIRLSDVGRQMLDEYLTSIGQWEQDRS